MAAPGDIEGLNWYSRVGDVAGPWGEFELREGSKIEFAGVLSSFFLSYISAIPAAPVKT